MRKLIPLLVLAAGVGSGFSTDLLAQSATSSTNPGPPQHGLEMKELARRIQERDRVRIESRWGKHELRSPILTRGGLEYSRAHSVTDPLAPIDGLGNPIPLSEVNRIQIRQSNAKKGAVIGGLVGAGLGLAFGVALANDDFFDVSGGDVVLLTVMQGAGGALSGALFGGMRKSWKTVYRQPEGRRSSRR